MAINQKTTTEFNMVKVPIIWTKTICGSKARVLYDDNYGIIDINSIPKTIVKISVKGNQIFLYSDKRFRKSGVLTFKRC